MGPLTLDAVILGTRRPAATNLLADAKSWFVLDLSWMEAAHRGKRAVGRPASISLSAPSRLAYTICRHQSVCIRSSGYAQPMFRLVRLAITIAVLAGIWYLARTQARVALRMGDSLAEHHADHPEVPRARIRVTDSMPG